MSGRFFISSSGQLRQCRIVFRKIFVIICVINGFGRIGKRQILCARLSIDIVIPSFVEQTLLLIWLVVSKAYAAYSELLLEIPRLGVKMDNVVIPQLKDGRANRLGNSVITAHVWDAFNNPEPFLNLKALSYGDKILIHASSLSE